ncbi:hypothetical protein [Falsirhodobacter sp. 1013]|uniref:hypothetical protein n=1 Tax=Falsirhodobacter sp. 1013 TaxID=3417566 RepID=UPI003EC136F4
MLTPTQNARAMLDILKTHHPDASCACSDAELLRYAMTDMLLLVDGLGLDAGQVISAAEVDARYEVQRLGPVDRAAFVEPPAIAAE